MNKRQFVSAPWVAADVDPRTRAVVANSTRQILADSDSLGAETLITLSNNFSLYGGRVPPEDLAAIAPNMVKLLASMLAQEPIPAELEDVPETLARRRLRQGVGLDELLHTVRRNFGVFWHALADGLSTDSEQQQPQVLRDAAILLWNAIDHVTGRIAAAYHDLELTTQMHRRAREAETFALWLAEGENDPDVAERAATDLQMTPSSMFVACVGRRTEDPNAYQAKFPVDGLSKVDCYSYWQEHGNRFSGLLQLDDRISLDTVQAALAAHNSHAWLAISPPVYGAARVPKAFRLARTALRALLAAPAPSVRRVDEVALEAIAAEAGEVLDNVTAAPATALLSLSAADYNRLTTTLRSLLDTGSIAETAKTLYLHRNTVNNQITRIRQLTGLDPRRPREAALLVFTLGRCEKSGPG